MAFTTELSRVALEELSSLHGDDRLDVLAIKHVEDIINTTVSPVLTNTDLTVDHYAKYGVDTSGGPITLTVDSNVHTFEVFDALNNISPTLNCTVDFGGGLTKELNSAGDVILFYEKSNVWYYFDEKTKVGGIV